MGKLQYLVKSCAIATFSTTNPTWAGVGLSPGICGEMLAINYMNHVIAPAAPQLQHRSEFCLH